MLDSTKKRRWTEEEEEILSRMRPDYTFKAIASTLQRSVSAVRNRARQLSYS